jgi:hypothetical protein
MGVCIGLVFALIHSREARGHAYLSRANQRGETAES